MIWLTNWYISIELDTIYSCYLVMWQGSIRLTFCSKSHRIYWAGNINNNVFKKTEIILTVHELIKLWFDRRQSFFSWEDRDFPATDQAMENFTMIFPITPPNLKHMECYWGPGQTARRTHDCLRPAGRDSYENQLIGICIFTSLQGLCQFFGLCMCFLTFSNYTLTSGTLYVL